MSHQVNDGQKKRPLHHPQSYCFQTTASEALCSASSILDGELGSPESV